MREKLTIEVEPELRRRIQAAAASRDESLKEWVRRAVLRELEADLDGEEDLTIPAPGLKPRGGSNPPRPRSGRAVADAVLEDRR